ncbi:MAG: helix-turn-helix domain-containing protein [Acidobacteria bacterium]|nr:helix-turn-helix domain-containing protein [Acidobacteriota bacterium]
MAMASIGETIKRARLKRGLEIEQVARNTKISCRLLAAIEDEQFERLPGGVFTRSFVRQYARALGLDDDQFEDELRRILEPPEPIRVASGPIKAAAAPGPSASARQHSPAFAFTLPRPRPGWRLPRPRFRFAPPRPGPLWLPLVFAVCLVVIAGAIYSLWQTQRSAGRAPEDPVIAAAPPQNASAVADRGAAAVPPAQDLTLVRLKASEEVWVSVVQGGKSLFADILDPGESRDFEVSGELMLRIGNAAGLDLTLNGKSVGPVGPRGEIRVVRINGENFAVEAPKPAPGPLLDLY